MIRITFLTKGSMLFVLLVSNSVNPLLALPPKPNPIVKNNREISRVSNEIKSLLFNKGLDKEVAIKKVNKLFENSKHNSIDKLLHLYNNPELSISKERLNKTLSEYALHEKSLDLNSYSSLIGLVQSTMFQSLNKKQLDYINHIASLA